MAKLSDPFEYANNPSELAQQTALFMWAALPEQQRLYPELIWLHAVPNGGSRHKGEAARLKASGVKPGVFDLDLPVRRRSYCGLKIEMKKIGATVKDISDKQLEYFKFCTNQGYSCHVCFSFTDAKAAIEWYLEANR